MHRFINNPSDFLSLSPTLEDLDQDEIDFDDQLSLPSSTTAFSTINMDQQKQMVHIQTELAELRAQMALLLQSKAAQNLPKIPQSDASRSSEKPSSIRLAPPPPPPPPFDLFKKKEVLFKTSKKPEIEEKKISFVDVLKDMNNVKLRKVEM